MRIGNYGVLAPILLLYSLLNPLTVSAQSDSELLQASSVAHIIAPVDTFSIMLYDQPETDLDDQQQPDGAAHLMNRLSGDWFGVRNELSNAGIEIDFQYKGDLFANINEALPDKSRALDNIDLIFSHDLQKSIGLGNSRLLVQFLGNSGGAASELSETCQGISNIEATPTWKLYQLQLESNFFEEQFSVLIGLYDLNSEFDSRETSSMFINPAHGIGTEFALSGLNGPSIFPTTSLAIRLKYQNESGMYLQAAAMDGVPGNPENPFGTHIILDKNEGLLLTTEAGIVSLEEEELDYKIAIGGWTYTSGVQTLNLSGNFQPNPLLQRNYGLYVSAEKKLYSNPLHPESKIHGFLRAGAANADVNPVDLYIGCGLTFTSILTDTDQLGFAAAFAHTSPYYRITSQRSEGITVNDYEINLEATYSFQPTPWLTIQPDLQYVINPAFCVHKHNSLVFGSRVILSI